jgi:hypothetical protein
VSANICLNRENDQDGECSPCSTDSIDHGKESVAENTNREGDEADSKEDEK